MAQPLDSAGEKEIDVQVEAATVGQDQEALQLIERFKGKREKAVLRKASRSMQYQSRRALDVSLTYDRLIFASFQSWPFST
jgi:hypothetical protein